MNPADAFRKAQRKKEIARNKAERQYIRSAFGRRDKPQELREELMELIELEQQGVLSKLQKIRKKVLQEAYDTALKRQKVRRGCVPQCGRRGLPLFRCCWCFC